MDYIEKTEEIRKFTQEAVKKSRYEHSVRVAQMCARLCRYYGLDEKKGYLAGIGHDMCKDFSSEELIFLAKKDGNPIKDFEKAKPALLHGRAAAVLMKEKFGIEDADILEAVANHTSGKQGMCNLTKCLFIADKIEPGRPQVTDKYLERLFKMKLDEMLYTILQENFDYLKGKGIEIAPELKSMLEFYKELVRNS